MGTTGGELCACRAAGAVRRFNVTTAAQSITQLSEFLNERWKGVQPAISTGDAARKQFTRWFYQGLCGLEEHRGYVHGCIMGGGLAGFAIRTATPAAWITLCAIVTRGQNGTLRLAGCCSAHPARRPTGKTGEITAGN